MVADKDSAALCGDRAGGKDFEVVEMGGEESAEALSAPHDNVPFKGFGGFAGGIHGAGK